MILLNKHTVHWKITHQRNQAQFNKDKIQKNSKRVYHDYRVGDKIMLNNGASLKYEMTN